MSELYGRYKFITEAMANREKAIKEVEAEERKQVVDEAAQYQAMLEARDLKEKKRKEFINFSTDVKDMLMTEAMTDIIYPATIPLDEVAKYKNSHGTPEINFKKTSKPIKNAIEKYKKDRNQDELLGAVKQFFGGTPEDMIEDTVNLFKLCHLVIIVGTNVAAVTSLNPGIIGINFVVNMIDIIVTRVIQVNEGQKLVKVFDKEIKKAKKDLPKAKDKQAAKRYIAELEKGRNKLHANLLRANLEGANPEYNYTRNVVYGFIKENGGADEIMMKASGRSLALECMFNEINSTHEFIMEKADKDDPKVDKEDVTSFLDKLELDDNIQTMSKTIAARVANSEEEFINDNIADKEAIKDIVDDTAKKIKKAKDDTSIKKSETEEISNEATRMGKARINAIRDDRPRSIFEHMVRTLSERAMKNTDTFEHFSENGELSVGKVVDRVRTLYSVLEGFNTTQLLRVNESFLENALK